MVSSGFYLVSPLISVSVAYRFYWKYEGFLGSTQQIILCVIVCALQVCMFISHNRAMFSDPGFVGENIFKVQGEQYEVEGPPRYGFVLNPSEEPKVCRVESCGALKVKDVHHCSTCGKCVYMMDHHCIWIGNCVGRGNFKYFMAFNICVIIQTSIGLAIILASKLFHEEAMELQNMELNFIKTFMLYNTLPLRESIAQFYVPDYIASRTSLGLFDYDDKGNEIFPEGYDAFAYRDDILYLSTLGVFLFTVLMSYAFLEGVRTGSLYIDQLKSKNMEKFKKTQEFPIEEEKKAAPTKSLKEIYEFVFQDEHRMEEISKHYINKSA